MNTDAERFITACAALAGRCGALEWQVRYSDDDEPTIWMAAAKWRIREFPDAKPREQWEAAGGMSPQAAAIRLLESVMDGGTCRHCGRVTGVDSDWSAPPADHGISGGPAMCWYRYDPELATFRRSCEGE